MKGIARGYSIGIGLIVGNKLVYQQKGVMLFDITVFRIDISFCEYAAPLISDGKLLALPKTVRTP